MPHDPEVTLLGERLRVVVEQARTLADELSGTLRDLSAFAPLFDARLAERRHHDVGPPAGYERRGR